MAKCCEKINGMGGCLFQRFLACAFHFVYPPVILTFVRECVRVWAHTVCAPPESVLTPKVKRILFGVLDFGPIFCSLRFLLPLVWPCVVVIDADRLGVVLTLRMWCKLTVCFVFAYA
jgi:hypothetical protein